MPARCSTLVLPSDATSALRHSTRTGQVSQNSSRALASATVYGTSVHRSSKKSEAGWPAQAGLGFTGDRILFDALDQEDLGPVEHVCGTRNNPPAVTPGIAESVPGCPVVLVLPVRAVGQGTRCRPHDFTLPIGCTRVRYTSPLMAIF